MTAVDDYLAIPEAYGRWLGGLRWSADGEAVEFAADDPEIGLTFAMSAEVARFVEGLSGNGNLLHFPFVLHLLHALGFGQRVVSGVVREPASPREFEPLAREFRETGRPLRNAGAMFAALLRDLPRPAVTPRLPVLVHELNARSVLRGTATASGGWRRRGRAEEPPLTPREFEGRIRAAVAGLSGEAIRHWLRHGRGPIPGAGEAVARVVHATPAEALAAAEERPRLKAAASLVARLDGALSLPPRRLARAELPVGGYTDVTTRGQPEQILPGQLALDPDEFLRRFAGNELLYYHREEPRAPAARELLLVIDQGVRTWGVVRLVLAAAALALGRQAARRGLAMRVATTGNGGEAVDPLAEGPSALGELLEASDLTPGPAEALARALGSLDEAPRDVVLLTHPRNLAGHPLEVAAGLAPPASRLFAVAADTRGEVALAELRHGAPVPVARCRVDVSEPTAEAGAAKPPAPAPSAAGWRGDVEPVGFPFRLGVQGPVRDHHFAFDDAGDWLFLAERTGLLHAWRCDGSGGEMLPRASGGEGVLTDPRVVIGVAGGFVVVGIAGVKLVAAHYDLGARTCTVHDLPPSLAAGPTWAYAREYHAVLNYQGDAVTVAIDLGADRTTAVHARERPGSSRAAEAARAYARRPSVGVVASAGPAAPLGSVLLDERSGQLTVWDGPSRLNAFTPLSEGREELKGARLLRGHWNGRVLALLIAHPDGRRVIHAYLPGPRWVGLEQQVVARDTTDFAMSPDGRRIAWRVGSRQVQAKALGSRGAPPLSTPKGRFHPDLKVALGRTFLVIQAGRHAHVVRWARGWLEFHRAEGLAHAFAAKVLGGRVPYRDSTAWGPRLPAVRDLVRFFAVARYGDVTAAVDRFGQVAVLDRAGAVAAMFHAFRGEVAAWEPGGASVGPVPVIGGPPTTGGVVKIGAALLAASGPDGEQEKPS